MKMRKILPTLLIVGLVASSLAGISCGQQEAPQAESEAGTSSAGWVNPLNGTDLGGWHFRQADGLDDRIELVMFLHHSWWSLPSPEFVLDYFTHQADVTGVFCTR
ncbi:MAG: hypothetical protein O7F56_03905 [Acidobacteria bacterium]|nr:hypothetical protein [Acidobacteriota bacterium]